MTDRTRARTLAAESVKAGTPLEWFDTLYQEAASGRATVPWADFRPNPNLVEWLDDASMRGEGRHALIVGCGYGDDAEELARRGFDVTAFDISATVIVRCRERFPESPVSYEVADLLQPQSNWHRQFDFVFEAYTLQVLPPNLRAEALSEITDFVAPGGTLLLVTRGRDSSDADGTMPWPLTREELSEFSLHMREESFEDYVEDEEPPVRRFRLVFRRSDDRC